MQLILKLHLSERMRLQHLSVITEGYIIYEFIAFLSTKQDAVIVMYIHVSIGYCTDRSQLVVYKPRA